MLAASGRYAPEISGTVRTMLLLMGIVLTCLLATARCLRPDPAGFGTHQQLGFAQCTMIRWCGKPCPSCGMTTAWAWLTRGRVLQAAAANLGGVLTCLLAMGTAPWAIVSAVNGRWCYMQPRETLLILLAILVTLVTLADWFNRIWMTEWL